MTVGEIAERYQCSTKTARRYMRQMEHMEKPLRVTESAVALWEMERTREPEGTKPIRSRSRQTFRPNVVYISRVREAK